MVLEGIVDRNRIMYKADAIDSLFMFVFSSIYTQYEYYGRETVLV